MATGDKLVTLDGLKAVYDVIDDDISDVKSALVIGDLNNGNGVLSQGYWAFSNGVVSTNASNYVRSIGYVNAYDSVSIDESYGFGIGLQAFENGTYIGTWNASTSAFEKTGYKAAFMAYSHNIADFVKTYPNYDFTLTIRKLADGNFTVRDLNDKIRFVYNANSVDSIFPVEIVGDYNYVDTNLPDIDNQTGRWWNIRIYKTIPVGRKFSFQLIAYSGTDFQSCTIGYINSSNSLVALKTGIAIGELCEIVAPVKIDTLYIQIVRATEEKNVNVKFGLLYSKAGVLYGGRVFRVEKDGSGDFSTIVSAVNEATKYDSSVVYVGDGTYDILTELGSTYLNNVSSDKNTWGLYLKNNIHLIFSSNSKVTANYTGTNTNVKTYFSVFNAGEGGFTLENANIESSNIRYCVHDDPGITTQYNNKYINCRMFHDNANNADFTGFQCIGGGLGKCGYIEIDGCYFDGHNRYSDIGGIVSYHNYSGSTGKGNIFIKNCYMNGAYTIRFSWYGTSTEKSIMTVCGCSLGATIVHQAETSSATVENTEVLAFNNEIRS